MCKKFFSAAVFFALIFTSISFSSYAADDQLQKNTRQIIKRTAAVIVIAQKAVKKGQKKAGLANAVAHQKYARQLQAKGTYKMAIYHSLRARALALVVIKQNKGNVPEKDPYNKIEKEFQSSSPPDSELDRKIGEKDLGTDEAAVDISIETDIE